MNPKVQEVYETMLYSAVKFVSFNGCKYVLYQWPQQPAGMSKLYQSVDALLVKYGVFK
jgi:hypothetical protein